jgi:hypothetical protein
MHEVVNIGPQTGKANKILQFQFANQIAKYTRAWAISNYHAFYISKLRYYQGYGSNQHINPFFRPQV